MLNHAGTNTGCSQRNANGCHWHSEGYKLPRIPLFPLLRYPKTRKQTLTAQDLLLNNSGFQQSSTTDRHGFVPGARFGSRKRALPGGRCAAAAGIQTSLGCATEQLLPAQTRSVSKLFSSSCLRPPLSSLGEQLEWPMRSDRTGEGKHWKIRPGSPGPEHVSSLTSPWHMQSQHCVHRENAPRKCFFLRFLFCRHLGGKRAVDQMAQSNAFHQICGLGPWGNPSSQQDQFTTNTGATSHQEAADHLNQPVKSKAGQDRGQTPGSWLGRCLRGCSYSHTVTSGSWGAATVRDHWTQMPKFRAQHRPQWCVNTLNSYMQAHTYSLNDTENTCAVSLA